MKLRTLVLAPAAAIALVTTLISTSSPATAADTYTLRIVPGAYGKLSNITWSSAYRANFTFEVSDTDADGDHAEARVQVKNPNGVITSFSWHSAVGHMTRTKFDTYAQTSSPIAAIRIEVCRKGDTLTDICGTSSWVYQF